MSRTISVRMLLLAASLAGLLVSAGVALGGAYGAVVDVKAPSSVALGAAYSVKVSGLAPGKANELVAFEGGSVRKALHCYPTFASELRFYRNVQLAQQYPVHGRFTNKTFALLAQHTGPKALCAYVINTNAPGGPSTFAHGSATWTVS